MNFGRDIGIGLHGIPPSLNRFAGRENSHEYREAKEYWTQYVRIMAYQHKPEQPFERAVVHITYTFKDRIRRDPDNYCGKMLLDGLTKAGIIKDDSFKHIDLWLSASEETGEPTTWITVQEVLP